MKTTLLVTDVDIKTNSLVGGNVDANKLYPDVKQAQLTVIKPLIGTQLYNKILTEFENNTLTGLYDELYSDYLKPMIIHAATAFYIGHGAYEVSNKGITKGGGEFNQGLTLAEVNTLADKQTMFYTNYKDGLVEFLDENKDSIPEWTKEDQSNLGSYVQVQNWVF